VPDPPREARARAASHYREFIDYGDAAGYQQRLPLLRAKLKNEKTTADPS
jgi:ferritin-like metal-binding protein YciE